VGIGVGVGVISAGAGTQAATSTRSKTVTRVTHILTILLIIHLFLKNLSSLFNHYNEKGVERLVVVLGKKVLRKKVLREKVGWFPVA
jgi:preprotein translocase subunit SecG